MEFLVNSVEKLIGIGRKRWVGLGLRMQANGFGADWEKQRFTGGNNVNTAGVPKTQLGKKKTP